MCRERKHTKYTHGHIGFCKHTDENVEEYQQYIWIWKLETWIQVGCFCFFQTPKSII